MDDADLRDPSRKTDTLLLVAIAAATIIIHLLVGNRYGFHRDELATLDDARHLAWGYVAYPPVTPFFGCLSLWLFGTSLAGFRFFAAVASALAVILTGLIARELGGRRSAQLMAAAAAVPWTLAAGSLMQYVAFDYLCWVLLAYFVVRLSRSHDPRWWIAIGIAIGFGALTKYSIIFFVVGIAVGALLTPLRNHLQSKWLWLGALCSFVIFLPNFIWQLQHDFISLDFLRYIHARDMRIGRTKDFLPDQLFLTLLAFPLAMLGLYFYLVSKDGRGFRALGWMYIVPLVLFIMAKGRGYYLTPAYPMLFAGGSVWLQGRLAAVPRNWSGVIAGFVWLALTVDVLVAAAVTLPLVPINSRWWTTVVALNDDLAEEVGWPELVETVAQIRAALPEAERANVGILAGNYGEAGAINLYGPRHGLPQVICGTNSFWERGYGDPPPQTLIVLGVSREFLERHFESCEVTGQIRNRDGVSNEETTRHRDIFVCRRMRETWPEFWKNFRRYG